jgi:hypothetical protein
MARDRRQILQRRTMFASACTMLAFRSPRARDLRDTLSPLRDF